MTIPQKKRRKINQLSWCDEYIEEKLSVTKRPGLCVFVIQTYSDIHIDRTPLLGQDMTQGQIFKRSLTGLNSEFSFF